MFLRWLLPSSWSLVTIVVLFAVISVAVGCLCCCRRYFRQARSLSQTDKGVLLCVVLRLFAPIPLLTYPWG